MRQKCADPARGRVSIVKKKPIKVEVADTRRAAPRFELKFVIPFRLQERPDELLAGHVLNLGAGGSLGMQTFNASLDRLVKTGAVGSQAAQLALDGSEA